MSWESSDDTGVFDFWKGTIPASASRKRYRFKITDGTDTAWLNAHGISETEPAGGDFRVVPGFKTPDWAKDAIFYQIFPVRFRDGDSTNPDPDNRRTFNWDERTWNTEVFDLYRRLIHIRNSFPVLRTGSFRPLVVDNENRIYAFGRWNSASQIAIALNAQSYRQTVAIPVWQMSVPDGVVMIDQLSDTSHAVVNGSVTVEFDGYFGVILVRQ